MRHMSVEPLESYIVGWHSILASRHVGDAFSQSRIPRLSVSILLFDSKDQEDAFAVLDLSDIIKKIQTWRLKLPRVKLFYAVKVNDNENIVKILSLLGDGFDLASKGEMEKVMRLGVDPRRIIYANPCKQPSHIRCAAHHNIDLMTFDNESELRKIKKFMPQAKLVIRIRYDDESAAFHLGNKFGVIPKDVESLLSTATSLGLNIVGVAFHVGSVSRRPKVFHDAIQEARKVFDSAIEAGFHPYLLDIGGGFPGSSSHIFNEIADHINEALRKYFPEEDIQIIAEPGRYVVETSVTLVTNIISKRQVAPEAPDGAPLMMYYINDGIYSSFFLSRACYGILPSSPHPLNDMDERWKEEPLFSSSFWGQTLANTDKIDISTFLPELNLGDWIVWENFGAYTLVGASSFNGFEAPHVYITISLDNWLYLKRISNNEIQDCGKQQLEDVDLTR